MNSCELSDPITMRLPVDVLAAIEQVAGICDRTRSWVVVRALKSYPHRKAAKSSSWIKRAKISMQAWDMT